MWNGRRNERRRMNGRMAMRCVLSDEVRHSRSWHAHWLASTKSVLVVAKSGVLLVESYDIRILRELGFQAKAPRINVTSPGLCGLAPSGETLCCSDRPVSSWKQIVHVNLGDLTGIDYQRDFISRFVDLLTLIKARRQDLPPQQTETSLNSVLPRCPCSKQDCIPISDSIYVRTTVERFFCECRHRCIISQCWTQSFRHSDQMQRPLQCRTARNRMVPPQVE